MLIVFSVGMERKYVLGLALFLLVCLTAHSQVSLGLEAGIDRNELYTNNSYQTYTNYISANGFTIGIPVSYRIHNWVSVQSSLTYIQKNYEIRRSGFYTGIRQNNTNSYLQVPLEGHFSLGWKKLRAFVDAGVYAAYWVAGHISGTEANILNPVDSALFSPQEPSNELNVDNPYNYNEKYAFDSRKDRRWEWGLLAGAGISYQFSTAVQVFIEGRYGKSFSDQQKNYMLGQIPRYNQTGSGVVGLMVPVNRFFKHK